MTSLAKVLVPPWASVRAVLESMTAGAKQVALVVDEGSRLLGLVTDGDLRKALLRGASLESKIEEVMNRRPLTAEPSIGAEQAFQLMRRHFIRHLPLLDGERRVVDLLVMDDLLPPAVALDTCAVIMAGGQGTRLAPLTDSTPKPLIRVGGKPLLELLLERLRQSGIPEVILALHHKSDLIRGYLGDGTRLGLRLDYVEEPEPLGTMGGLTLMRDRLRSPFFVVNGDILTKCDFRSMWEHHRAQRDVAMTVGVSLHQVDIPYGEFALRDGRVTMLEEKPRKEFPVNAGIYVLEPSAVDLIPPSRYFDATDLIRLLLSQDRGVAAYLIREYWLDVGHHRDLEKANRDVAEGLLD
jgi:dTDP-glucose pyrophosphorylase